MRFQRRYLIDRLMRGFCVLATLAGLAFLASLLTLLLWRGCRGLTLTVFTHVTGSPGSGGGLLNAILGSLIQTTLGMAIGAPVGLLAGTYLAEYAQGSMFGRIVRFVSDMLLSAPSILIGLFIYSLLVEPFGGFSGWAGSVALAVIAIPIVIRMTEDMLCAVPVALREAAMSLGAPKWRTILQVSYPAARNGIMTGLLLAVARLAGETAPLLFTSLGNLNWSLRLDAPMASLPVTIYQYAGSAYPDWVQLAWAGALLITFSVLALNIVVRMIFRSGQGRLQQKRKLDRDAQR